jgi:hypothetical protein
VRFQPARRNRKEQTLKIKVLVHSVQPHAIRGYGNRFTGYGVMKDDRRIGLVIALSEVEGDTAMLQLRNHGVPVELTMNDTQIVGIEVPAASAA